MRGVIYFAVYNPRFVRLASQSAESLKQHMPSMHVTLFTDLMECKIPPVFDSVRYISPVPAVQKVAKMLALLSSPYDAFLFLDADTWVCDDISNVFECVEDDRVDIAAVLTYEKPARYCDFNKVFAEEGIPELFPFYCASVLMIQRNCRTTAFLEEWERHYIQMASMGMEGEKRTLPDEPSMRVALHRHPGVRIMPLNCEYGASRHGFFTHKVKIIHWEETKQELRAIERSINDRVGHARFVRHGRDVGIRV